MRLPWLELIWDSGGNIRGGEFMLPSFILARNLSSLIFVALNVMQYIAYSLDYHAFMVEK